MSDDESKWGFLSGGGEAAQLIAAFDWSKTCVGPIADWSQSLRTAVAILLRSSVPMVMLWGEDGIMLYNDAYSVFAGKRHPQLLGSKVREGWPEVADFNDNVMRCGLAGKTLAYQNEELTLHRHGHPEQVWMNLDYSPVPDESGKPAGVICILAETTGRVAAERRLAAERDRQLDLLQQMPGFTAVFEGPEHIFKFVNDSYRAISGHRDFLDKAVRQVFPSGSGQVFVDLLDQVFETGDAFSARALPLALNGDTGERFVDIVCQPVRDENGHVTGTFVGGYDVTERVLAERRRLALVEFTDRIQETYEEAGLAYAAGDILGRILGVSRVGYATIDPNAETLHVARHWNAPGVDPLEGVLQLRAYGSFIDSLKLGETIAISDVRTDVRTQKTSAALEARHARAFVNVPVIEGDRLSAVLYVNSALPRVWSEQEIVLIREFAQRARTAMERLRAEARLRDSEMRLRDLNDTLEAQVATRAAERDRLWNLSQDMLARADYEGMMSAVSPAWTQLLGWSEAELLSRGYATFMHQDDMTPTLEAIGRMAKTGMPTRFENRIAVRDGGWKHIEWTVAPEADNFNFIAVGRDISYTKAREAELESAREQLRQSQKMEAMGQLTGGVAHDFNNLLTPIVGALDMLQRQGPRGEREKRLIGGAAQSAERARVLVQRLLAFARRQPLQPIAVDVAKLVHGMADLVSSTTGPQIKIVVDVMADLPFAKADPNQLEMALLNLSVNARDAMPEGGTLRISASADIVKGAMRSSSKPELQPGTYIRLSIADTGVGMDESTLVRAVEPFFSTKGIGRGTGLGLSMVHGLASQLGGGLFIQSKPGLGTNVELWLPVTTARSEIGSVFEDAPVPSAAKGTALLVDDEELVRISTADMLSNLGYVVVEAGSAEEALRLLENGLAPTLIVTDHLMPGMTGVDLARTVRGKFSAIPILIVSGYSEDAIAPDLPRLVKPFRNADLAAVLAGLS